MIQPAKDRLLPIRARPFTAGQQRADHFLVLVLSEAVLVHCPLSAEGATG